MSSLLLLLLLSLSTLVVDATSAADLRPCLCVPRVDDSCTPAATLAFLRGTQVAAHNIRLAVRRNDSCFLRGDTVARGVVYSYACAEQWLIDFDSRQRVNAWSDRSLPSTRSNYLRSDGVAGIIQLGVLCTPARTSSSIANAAADTSAPVNEHAWHLTAVAAELAELHDVERRTPFGNIGGTNYPTKQKAGRQSHGKAAKVIK